ncbi:MAG: hypothetical protein JXA92_03580 [candidate division Zixibacteria bacterium]|nr:hypothetical protein [candidate division Zixibacteria bacterium]
MSDKIFYAGKEILFIASFVLLFRSMYLRKPDHPWIVGKLSFREGIKFWKFKEYWKPRGYAYYVISLMGITVSTLWSLFRLLS